MRRRRSQRARHARRPFWSARSGHARRPGWPGRSLRSLGPGGPTAPAGPAGPCAPAGPGGPIAPAGPGVPQLPPGLAVRPLLQPAARHQSRDALAASLHLQVTSRGILLALPTECPVRPGIELDAAARADFHNGLGSARLDAAADPKASAGDLSALNGDGGGRRVDSRPRSRKRPAVQQRYALPPPSLWYRGEVSQGGQDRQSRRVKGL